jgi:hypothetical protein
MRESSKTSEKERTSLVPEVLDPGNKDPHSWAWIEAVFGTYEIERQGEPYGSPFCFLEEMTSRLPSGFDFAVQPWHDRMVHLFRRGRATRYQITS